MADDQASIFCPECGGPAIFRGTTVTMVCEYCGSTLVRTGVDLRLVGKVSAIIDNGSPILLNSHGRYRGARFEVTGRLQVGFDRGAWNEWFLRFSDGNHGWLSDALGQFAIVRPWDQSVVAGKVPGHAEMQVGQLRILDGIHLTVVDVRAAEYLGSEGELPFVAQPGLRYFSADLRGPKGEFVTLDWGSADTDGPPTPYLGQAVELRELTLYPVRQFEGWPAPPPPLA